jgi:hypothetical protein
VELLMPYETYDKLVAEADALPASKPPSWQFYNPISQQRKSEEEYDKDQRRLYILDRLKEVQNDAPNILDPGPLRKQLASPVEHYAQPGFPVFNEEQGRTVQVPGQYLGEDSPIWKGLTWMGSPVSAVANASRELANQADRGVSYMLGQDPVEHYPNALNNAIKDVGDFAAGFPGPPGPGLYSGRVGKDGKWQAYNNGTRWDELREMRQVMESEPISTVDQRPTNWLTQHGYASEQTDHRDTLETVKFLPEPVPLVLGTVMNITTDPLNGMFQAAKLARQGKNLPAWKALMGDFGPPLAIEGVIENPELVRQAIQSGQDATRQIRGLLPGRY